MRPSSARTATFGTATDLAGGRAGDADRDEHAGPQRAARVGDDDPGARGAGLLAHGAGDDVDPAARDDPRGPLDQRGGRLPGGADRRQVGVLQVGPDPDLREVADDEELLAGLDVLAGVGVPLEHRPGARRADRHLAAERVRRRLPGPGAPPAASPRRVRRDRAPSSSIRASAWRARASWTSISAEIFFSNSSASRSAVFVARSSAAAFFSRSAFASATSWLSISKRTSPAATRWPASAGEPSTTPDERARDVHRARVADVHLAGEPHGLLERRGAGGDRVDQPRLALLRHHARVELHDAELVAALVAGVVRDVVLALPREQLVDRAVEVRDLGLAVAVAVALAVAGFPLAVRLAARLGPCSSRSAAAGAAGGAGAVLLP